MEHHILYYHRQLQKHIRAVEQDETDQEALNAVTETFLPLFDMIKTVMISKQDRYYGLFLMNFELRIDYTAYHDAGVSIDTFPFRMTVNPLLIGMRPLQEMIYIFCHEIEHIVLCHPVDTIKYNPQKDPLLGFKLNIAMDASINDRLTADSSTDPHSIIAQPKDSVTSAYLREDFRLHLKPLQAFDYYLERIPDPSDGKGSPIKILFVQGGEQQIITRSKKDGTVYLPCWTVSDDPDEVEGIIRKYLSDICEGMSETTRGSLPQYQKEALDRLLAPPTVTWKQLLKRYIGTIPYGHRKTRTRLSRRQPERYDISGSINDRLIKLIVAIDTSGSMTRQTLERIMTEIFGIIGTRMCRVTIIECDFKIQRVYTVHCAGDISYQVQGRGGTSFVPVIEYINSHRELRDGILIYFTDGLGDLSIPRPLIHKLLWVLHNEECRLSLRDPYGEILVMD